MQSVPHLNSKGAHRCFFRAGEILHSAKHKRVRFQIGSKLRAICSNSLLTE